MISLASLPPNGFPLSAVLPATDGETLTAVARQGKRKWP